MSWSFFQLWNSSLEQGRPERKIEERNHIWASEMGGSLVDRYLKMTGVKPTNPPDTRSLRKFEAGNIWEWILTFVLKRAGIFIDSQEWVQHQYPDLLKVTGKLDVFAGGFPDYEKARAEIDQMELPEFITRATNNIIENLQTAYPNGLKEIVLEIKSVSSFMFEKYQTSGNSNPNHRLQCFHYLKSKNKTEGHIVYVSKDDARLLEIGVMNPSPVEDEYIADIKAMTECLRARVRPDLEKPVVFDKDFGRFSANWKVAYSNYLTMLYGIKNQAEFDEQYKPKAEKYNRVIKRICAGKKMTAMNLEILTDLQKHFNIEECVEVAKKYYKPEEEKDEEAKD
jgi:hypothetical protein